MGAKRCSLGSKWVLMQSLHTGPHCRSDCGETSCHWKSTPQLPSCDHPDQTRLLRLLQPLACPRTPTPTPYPQQSPPPPAVTSRLSNFTVFVSDVEPTTEASITSSHVCAYFSGVASLSSSGQAVTCTAGNLLGRYVIIARPGNNGYLTICEAEINAGRLLAEWHALKMLACRLPIPECRSSTIIKSIHQHSLSIKTGTRGAPCQPCLL